MTNSPEDPNLEVWSYPRTYRVSMGWRVILVVLAIGIGPGSIAAVTFLFLSGSHGGGDPNIALYALLGAMAACFAGFGIYVAFSSLQYRLVLMDDAIETHEPFRRRRLSLSEIRGRRVVRGQQGPAILVLVPQNDAAKELKITLVLETDRAFDAWLARIVDLDAQEAEQVEKEITGSLPGHLTPQARAARVKRLRLLAQGFNVFTIAMFFLGFLAPIDHSLIIAILVILPWFAVFLVARFQPFYRFGGKRNDAHPDLSISLMLPGWLLTIYATKDAHPFDWTGPSILALIGGLALAGLALRVDPWFRRQRSSAALTCFFLLAYGFGAGFEIDVFADSSKPTVYATQVLGKRVSRGSKSTTFYFRVDSWGPFTQPQEISVSRGRYQTSQVGHTVCIFAGKGALEVPWYRILDCPDSSRMQSP